MAAATARWNHVWVGTETGILKGVNLQRKQAANFTAAGQPRREEAVSALCWGAGGEARDINSLNKQIAQLQDFVRAKGSQSGRHLQTHSNTIVVSLQVRVYDPASPQRRPVLESTYGEYPLTAMTLTPEGNSVIVGNTHGQLAEIDFRQGRLLGCLKGLAGSVRGLQCHPSKPLLASCGLDRVLRIHRIRNPRGLEHKIYLKSRLNCLLLSGRDNWEDEPQEQEPDKTPIEDTETDELWASLEAAAKRKLTGLDPTHGAHQTKRKKKRPGSTSS
ncbi:PREDICTED: WD repeat-containing protein 74 [Dipodomys ordii]|uniref:WD repeat-containing protein 74 n=1 Tax=Dipodomys ordii TaxID=10020 RepID=A0A1S3G836_DIPOR|nr:PREDICTED: WD repeat-containing protein 74 [Dipodomys ordii]